MEVKQLMNSVINSTAITDPEFSNSLKKWKPRMQSAVKKLSYITGVEEEDIFQDVLMNLVEVAKIHSVPLYRFKKRLYEKVMDDGTTVILKTPRYNKGNKEIVAAHKDKVEPVKKSKLESTIYREINQQLVDITNSHFTRKNGYKKTLSGTKRVTVRSDKDNVKFKEKNFHTVEKTVEIIGIDDSDGVLSIADNNTIEETVYASNCLDHIRKSVSDVASNVLNLMLEESEIIDTRIAQTLSYPIDTIKYAKFEIMRSFPDKKQSIPTREPIYFSANESIGW